jgi:hypothetical protein
MQIRETHKTIVVALTIAGSIAFLIMGALARHTFAQSQQTSALVVRVAVFSNDQGRLDHYRDFIGGHLFPTLRAVPGYVGIFLGRDPSSGQLISLSFWRSEADAMAGEEAVGRAIRGLPQGSAPRPSKIERYVVEYRDLREQLSK